ncbi:MAG: hypothetical protein ACJA04_000950 [Cellvibrionaceae bacterium]|jgi:hypothetical protein
MPFFRCLIIYILALLTMLASQLSFSAQGSCPLVDSQVNPAIIGRAISLDDGKPLYCEYHFYQFTNDKTLVEYRDLNGQLFAQKQLDFSVHPLKPDVMQEDFRHGELRRVERSKNTANPSVLVSLREANTNQIKEVEILIEDRLIVDAGFDAAIRQWWNLLLSGEQVKVNFLSPIHMRTFNLMIEESEGNRCAEAMDDENRQVCFLISPSNRLIGLFVKPLVLVYERAGKRLSSYQGSVNITSLEGESLKAKIFYSYPEPSLSISVDNLKAK